MADSAASSFERACQKRYPAWTLYARALTGNRPEADSVVRRAVHQTLGRHETEAEAHQSVLRSIRDAALPRATTDLATEPSVLVALRDDEPEAIRRIRLRLKFLPRLERRAIRMVLLRRPPLSLPSAARKLGLTEEDLSTTIELALIQLSGVKARRSSDACHIAFVELNAYVTGALSGDEARDVATHARACSSCGDRLGTMMLLKSSTALRARTPFLSRGQKKTGLMLLVVSALVASVLIADAFWPNPWAEHATRENVPVWFHEFFYGERRATEPTELSRALELLVQGELDEAISLLAPMARADAPTPETLAYLGIARYLGGDTSRRTVRLLEDGVRSQRAGRLSRWYLASTHLARRDVESATRELRALTTTRDWFGRAAENLLEELDQTSKSRISARLHL